MNNNNNNNPSEPIPPFIFGNSNPAPTGLNLPAGHPLSFLLGGAAPPAGFNWNDLLRGDDDAADVTSEDEDDIDGYVEPVPRKDDGEEKVLLLSLLTNPFYIEPKDHNGFNCTVLEVRCAVYH